MSMEKKGLPKIEAGYRVGKLEVTRQSEARKNGYRMWECRCGCGGSILLDTRTLQRGAVQSCGCAVKGRSNRRDLTGQRFGQLVVLEATQERGSGGALLWRCRCDCGNTCETTSGQLTAGYKKSCGCLGKPPLKEFVGKRFGQLTVVEYAGKVKGMHRWKCVCDCGQETTVGQTLLQSGKTKSCGCLGHPPVKDIQGQQFGDLTALEFIGKQEGQYYWRCRCRCGKETTVRQNYLLMGKTKSCGCLQAKMAVENMKFIDGTSVTKLEKAGQRLASSNSSGYNGVYWNRKTQKWAAQIGFKGKTYYLGSFAKIEDAVDARKKAENRIYGEFLEWYYEMHPRK